MLVKRCPRELNFMMLLRFVGSMMLDVHNVITVDGFHDAVPINTLSSN